LLSRGPLRTVRATRRGTRLKRVSWACGIVLQVPDPGPVLLPCRLEDSLPQPPYFRLTGTPIHRVPFAGALRSVHLAASNLPVGTSVHHMSSSMTHLPTSARFRVQATGRRPGPVSGQLYEAILKARSFASISCPLSRFRHSLLGHPSPAQELGLPHGRLTDPCDHRPDLDGVSMFRTCEIRLG
jgi:hypothetical protein